MEYYTPILIFVVLLVLFSLCGWCCRQSRTQGTVFSTPVVVTSTTHHPLSSGPPGPGQPYPIQTYQSSQPSYPIAPYPTNIPQGMPQPIISGFYPNSTPYPPMGGPVPQVPYPPQGPYPHQAGFHAPDPQPPSYAEATTTTVTTEVYSKQAPYNPNF